MRKSKKSANAKRPAVSSSRLVRLLGRKLWEAGLSARVKFDGYDQHSKWENLSNSQYAAWDAVAKYVLEMKRPN
jgi:hypothetical protein